MAVLVSKTMPRKDIMALAETLRNENAGHLGEINIFDARYAWEHKLDETITTEELYKHWLVQISGLSGEWPDGKEIHWVAEGDVGHGN